MIQHVQFENIMRIQRLDIFLLLVLVVASLAVRLPIVQERKIMPAGDAFNFQHITSQILHFNYPIKEKRLPVYSIFLIPGRIIGADPIRTSITMSLLAGCGILVGLYLLGRQLQIDRKALLLMLSLAIFDPLLTINAIRPLSDSTFVCLVIFTILLTTKIVMDPSTHTRKFFFLTGGVMTFMMFTRYEGFILAALLSLYILWRLRLNSWQVFLIPVVVSIAWIPAYIHIHGSLTGLGYIEDAQSSEGGFGEWQHIPENIDKMVSGTGWSSAWAIPADELTQEPIEESPIRVLSSPAWWLGVLSIIGLLWIFVRNGTGGLPLVTAIVGYTLLLAWWWVYSRYVAPLSAIFYLGAAAGLSALFSIAGHKELPWWTYVAQPLTILVIIFGAWILHTLAPLHYGSALSRAWENNQKGYALFSATKFAGNQHKPVFYRTDEHAFATLYLGILKEPKSWTNKGLGLYLSRYPNASTQDLYNELQTYRVGYVIDTHEEPRIDEVLQLLEKEHRVQDVHTFSETQWSDGDTDSIQVYELQWQ